MHEAHTASTENQLAASFCCMDTVQDPPEGMKSEEAVSPWHHSNPATPALSAPFTATGTSLSKNVSLLQGRQQRLCRDVACCLGQPAPSSQDVSDSSSSSRLQMPTHV